MSAIERDQMLLAGELRKMDANRYEFIGQNKTVTVRSFADLGDVKNKLRMGPETLKRFLEGSFIWEHGDERMRELLETPEMMAFRLTEEGIAA